MFATSPRSSYDTFTPRLYPPPAFPPPLPAVIEIDTLTPFGEYIGQSNTTYQNFVAGPQSPKWFNVSGIDACQENSQCNSNTLMMHRIQTRSKAAFLHHFFAARVAKAQKEAKEAQIKLAALTASA